MKPLCRKAEWFFIPIWSVVDVTAAAVYNDKISVPSGDFVIANEVKQSRDIITAIPRRSLVIQSPFGDAARSQGIDKQGSLRAIQLKS